MRPEDVLSDHANEATFGGREIRKGSVAAFLANAHVITDAAAAPEARREAEQHLRALVPALAALAVFAVFAIRDEALRQQSAPVRDFGIDVRTDARPRPVSGRRSGAG